MQQNMQQMMDQNSNLQMNEIVEGVVNSQPNMSNQI